MDQYLALIPEFIVLTAAIAALFATLFGGDRAAAILGAFASLGAAAVVWVVPAPGAILGGMLELGPETPGLMLRSMLPALTAIFLAWVVARGWAGIRAREGVSLALFVTLGSMLLVSTRDIVVLYISLELSAMATYVLVGYLTTDRRSLEGALKYFLMSVLTSMFFAYGLSFVYGMNGTTAYQPLRVAGPEWLGTVVAVFVLFGMLAKIAAVPFHYWSPDATAGAPSTSAAFISSVAKVAPMWALVRFLAEVFPDVAGLDAALLISAVLSIALGTFAALPQTDVRRLVAYSGIANIGYALLAVSAGTAEGYAGAIFYVFAYALASLGLMLVVAQEGATLTDVAGLVKRRPYAAWAAVVFLFSIIGFPPFIGFYGKLAAFSAALNAGHVWAVVWAVLFSVIAGGYAFKVIRAMFTPGESAPEMVERSSLEESSAYRQYPVLAGAVILLLAALVLGLGLATEPVVALFEATLL